MCVQPVVGEGCVGVRLGLGYNHHSIHALASKNLYWSACCLGQFCVNEIWWAIQNGSQAYWNAQNRIYSVKNTRPELFRSQLAR